MFKVLNEKFNCAFGEELRPKNVNSDCEAGLIKSAKYIYKNIQVNLCQVHVRRSWERKLIEKIGKAKFNKSKIILSKTLTLLNGAFYVPIQFLTNIIAHLRNDITPILPFEIQNSFENFIKYLEAEYFFHNAIFKNTDWNYYGKDLSETSTNSVEAINKKLKRACNYGKINFEGACDILNRFKADYRSEYEYKVLQCILNPRKNQTILNMKNKMRITAEYNLLSVINQEIYVLQYSFKFSHFKRNARSVLFPALLI